MKHVIIGALLLTSCTQPQDASVQVLIGGTLEDGRGGSPLEHPVIVVKDGRIATVGPQAYVPIPRGSTKIDTTDFLIRPVTGKTIESGRPADLELVDKSGAVSRKMVRGSWQ